MDQYRTGRMVIRPGGKHKKLFRVTKENMRHAKAVYNTALFFMRNLFTGLKKEPDARTENERTVIMKVTLILDILNHKREADGKKPYAYPAEDAPWLSDYLWLVVMNRILKEDLPRPGNFYSKLEQQTVRSACRAMKSFWNASKDYRAHPDKYSGRPKLPHYLKEDSFTLDYDCQMVKCRLAGRRFQISLAGVPYTLDTGKKLYEGIVSVRLSFRHGAVIAWICTKKSGQNVQESERSKAGKPEPMRMIGIDPGIRNFLTVCPGYGSEPFIISGGKLKAVNRYYNKKRAALQSELKKQTDRAESRRLDRLSYSRENFLYNYFHQVSSLIVNYALLERAGTIVIGKNDRWKQNVQMGKKNNQKFVYIPHQRFFKILEDKAVRSGIRVIFTEESYTSRASALERDPLPAWKKGSGTSGLKFSGRRISRGQYQSADGTILNADVNGAANIIRKYCEEGLCKDLSYLTGTVRRINVA